MAQPAKLAVEKAEVIRVGRMLDQQYRVIWNAFQKFVKEATTPEVLQIVVGAAQGGNIEKLLQEVDKHIFSFANRLAMVSINSANTEAEKMFSNLKTISKAGEFDVTDPIIADVLRRNRVNTVQNLSRQQRELLREDLIAGIRKGESPAQIARRFKNTIGLTRVQKEAVATYQRGLETNDPKLALNRALTTPGANAQAQRAFDANDVLSASQIERMVGAYSRNLRNARAESIARTESLKLVGQARSLAFNQVTLKAGVDRSKATKTWLQTSARTPRHTHQQMVGDTVGIDEAFVSPTGARLLYPGDTSQGASARDIINCQCGVSYNLGG